MICCALIVVLKILIVGSKNSLNANNLNFAIFLPTLIYHVSRLTLLFSDLSIKSTAYKKGPLKPQSLSIGPSIL